MHLQKQRDASDSFHCNLRIHSLRVVEFNKSFSIRAGWSLFNKAVSAFHSTPERKGKVWDTVKWCTKSPDTTGRICHVENNRVSPLFSMLIYSILYLYSVSLCHGLRFLFGLFPFFFVLLSCAMFSFFLTFCLCVLSRLFDYIHIHAYLSKQALRCILLFCPHTNAG